MLIKILFVVLIIFRIFLFSLPSFQADMNTWKLWSERLVSVGPINFYSSNYFADYFPGYFYILWLLGNFYSFIFPEAAFMDFKFEFLVKTVTLAFDIGTSFFIYKIVKNYSLKLARIAGVLYLANPAVIFNSSIWGQIDGIFTFFLILSSYLLTEKKNFVTSSFWSSIGFLIKPQSIAFIPVVLIYLLRQFKRYSFFIFLIPIATISFLSIPFFGPSSIFGLFNLAKRSLEVYPYTSVFAFNFWGIFDWWQSDLKTFLFTFKVWGISLYIISLVLIIFPLIKNKIKSEVFYLASALSLIAFFLFLTRMHERYLFSFLPFILISAFLYKSRVLFLVYFFMTIIHLINLLFVYYYYQYVYYDSAHANNFLYRLINDNHGVFSILSLMFFAVILFVYYKKIYVEKN